MPSILEVPPGDPQTPAEIETAILGARAREALASLAANGAAAELAAIARELEELITQAQHNHLF